MGPDPILQAFLHFYHLDKSNAAVHMADVRFSPITFGLADVLGATNVYTDEVNEVLNHFGQYELDKGR